MIFVNSVYILYLCHIFIKKNINNEKIIVNFIDNKIQSNIDILFNGTYYKVNC